MRILGHRYCQTKKQILPRPKWPLYSPIQYCKVNHFLFSSGSYRYYSQPSNTKDQKEDDSKEDSLGDLLRMVLTMKVKEAPKGPTMGAKPTIENLLGLKPIPQPEKKPESEPSLAEFNLDKILMGEPQKVVTEEDQLLDQLLSSQVQVSRRVPKQPFLTRTANRAPRKDKFSQKKGELSKQTQITREDIDLDDEIFMIQTARLDVEEAVAIEELKETYVSIMKVIRRVIDKELAMDRFFALRDKKKYKKRTRFFSNVIKLRKSKKIPKQPIQPGTIPPQLSEGFGNYFKSVLKEFPQDHGLFPVMDLWTKKLFNNGSWTHEEKYKASHKLGNLLSRPLPPGYIPGITGVYERIGSPSKIPEHVRAAKKLEEIIEEHLKREGHGDDDEDFSINLINRTRRYHEEGQEE